MEILNIIVTDCTGIIQVKSFPIIDPNKREAIVQEAEKYFIQEINKWGNIEDTQQVLDDGYYEIQNVNIYLWKS